MTAEFKQLELLINLGRDQMEEMLLHYKDQDLEASDHQYLKEEILHYYNKGCPSIDELTDKELAKELVHYIERDGGWEYFEENVL